MTRGKYYAVVMPIAAILYVIVTYSLAVRRG